MKNAFSLVELSIVLVILGLLTGGILGGQALIRAAELRSVTTEYQRWVTATQTFRDKYFALPGDMTNATRFWGALDGNNGIASDCRGESNTLLTCNGDGNGLIQGYVTSASFTHENFLFWQHLANAGLIEGKYSGNFGQFPGNTICTGTDHVPGCNVPLSKISRGFWFSTYGGTSSGSTDLFDGNYDNLFALSNNITWTGGQFQGNLLRAEEAWNIDTKLDDGKPGLGSMVASRWGACTTAANSADISNAAYRLNTSTQICMPIMRNAF